MKVSFAWLQTRANKINQFLNPQSSNKLPVSGISEFIRRYRIKLRRVQRKIQAEKQQYLPAMTGLSCGTCLINLLSKAFKMISEKMKVVNRLNGQMVLTLTVVFCIPKGIAIII